MARAMLTTIFLHLNVTIIGIAIAIAIGGVIGFITARKIAMTAMPQLVAAFHSLVGMAAVLVAAAAYLNPAAFGIADLATGQIFTVSRIEMSLRSEEHTSELQSLMRISYAVFCLKKKKNIITIKTNIYSNKQHTRCHKK